MLFSSNIVFFYIRETKFDVINYVFIDKSFTNKSISKYLIAKKFDITSRMLKN